MYYVQLQCLCGFVAGVLAGKRIGHRIQPQPGRLACLITRAITQGGRVVSRTGSRRVWLYARAYAGRGRWGEMNIKAS